MRAKQRIASTVLALALTGPAFAQTVLYHPDGTHPRLSKPSTSLPDRRRADTSRNGIDQGAQPIAGPQNVLKTITGDVTGFLNTVFGIRDGKPDDPSAMARE